MQLSQSTVDLVSSITRPLINTGTLHKSEHSALIKILKSHTVGNTENSIPDNPQKLCTTSEASKILSISKRSILRMVAAGELESVYLRQGSPKTLRIKVVSIDALLTGQEAI